ncbi:TetR/AcrR family transcriptional regulator [Hamadaea tsunoensis]|uniref:TetR/AcrR family transcriptional regulator n=1 Tax=Hamadaea tsunoensis TaxID=53368 RepID=UPI00040AC5D1|nr:TetR/AcrR family transcriptional regulator [Hamadaea tsunoensis]
MSLRERKKEQTREALSWAALHLAVERGIENVRVEDIAAAAGVSARTFNNYFTSKFEAIYWRALARSEAAAVAVRERPAGEPLWDAVIAAVVEQYTAEGESRAPEGWQAGVRAMMQAPEMTGEYLKLSRRTEREMAVAVADRTGTDLDKDLYPHLVAAAVAAAVYVATDRWMQSEPPVPPMASLIEDGLRQIAAGLPAPR